jgi:uncharacterized lipoprotein YajG
MRKPRVILAIIFLALNLAILTGCETTKNIITGIADGVPKDWANLAKVDAWIKKNLW